MNANEPQFWMMIASIIIAICFIVMAFAILAIAIVVRKTVTTVNRVEQKLEPLLDKMTAIGDQGKSIAVQFNEISGHLSTASRHFSESAGLVKQEVAELRTLVGKTAIVAKDKVELVSDTIDRTHLQVITTTDFINTKIVEPAREIAAVMAGLRRGLEVLFAPSPKRIDSVYGEEELFIG
jgi:uncharacterized protein YoxC